MILSFRGQPNTIAAQEHERATVKGIRDGQASALIDLLRGWASYAGAHAARYESPIGDDAVLGDAWADLGRAITRLLDGETGGLDAGSISQNIEEAIERQGL